MADPEIFLRAGISAQSRDTGLFFTGSADIRCRSPPEVLETSPTFQELGGAIMHYDMVACGQRIQALRRQAKISQARMSEILAISTVHLSNVERGINGASVELLVDMAIHFNVSLDYLILGIRILPMTLPTSWILQLSC